MRKDNKGFTLIEVILAMAVMTLVFLPMMKYFTDSLRMNQKIREKQSASFLAETPIEETRAVKTADDLAELLLEKGFQMTTGENPDNVVYTGSMAQDGKDYEVSLSVDFTAAEVTAYNQGTEAALIPFNEQTDIRAVEGNQMDEAAYYFSVLNQSYCDRLAAQKPPVIMQPLSLSAIKSGMSREMAVKAEKNGTEYEIKIYYTYTSSAPGCGGYTFSPETGGSCLYRGKKQAEDWKALYLFYERMPGGGEDTVSFDISGGTAPLKKLYLVCQGEENAPMINPVVAGLTEFKDCTLYINGTPKTIPNGITWYRAPAGSGIDGGEGYDLISQKDAKRVAKITASVFRKGGLEPLAVLESRKGE